MNRFFDVTRLVRAERDAKTSVESGEREDNSYDMPYSVHAGCVREHEPSRMGSLYECEVDDAKAKALGIEHAWYDFYAQAVSTDREGHVDNETVGATHPAARSSGKETAFRPSVKNCAPRRPGWKPSETNTQTPPRK